MDIDSMVVETWGTYRVTLETVEKLNGESLERMHKANRFDMRNAAAKHVRAFFETWTQLTKLGMDDEHAWRKALSSARGSDKPTTQLRLYRQHVAAYLLDHSKVEHAEGLMVWAAMELTGGTP